MQVNDILRTKGCRVVTTDPEATLGELARLLTWEGVGSAVVLHEGRVSGMITERDILRALADHGANALRLPVSQRMSRAVVACSPDDPVDGLLGVMTARRIRHLPVLEGEWLAGIISLGDVVKSRLEETAAEASLLRDYVTAH